MYLHKKQDHKRLYKLMRPYLKKRHAFTRPYLYDTLDVFIKPRKKDFSMADLKHMTLFQVMILRYGIGYALAKQLCFFIGYSPKILYRLLHRTENIRALEHFFVKYKKLLDFDLQKKRIFEINNLILIRSYRGIRHRNGYPTRGQRTRCNYKTARRLNFNVQTLLKELEFK